MSRVYRALERAEREKQERLQRKTSFEKPRESEVSKKEEEFSEYVRGETESLGPNVRQEVSAKEKLQRKTFLERPRKEGDLKKEEVSLEYTRQEGESLNPPVREEVPVLVSAENPIAAEEFRRLKTNVFHWSPNPPHLILVTSTTPNEGKTFVSLNLAMAISLEINKKAILVDADLRKPSIYFEKYNNSKGLSNYLTERTPLAEILVRSEAENLWIIPAGPPSRKSPELIGSKRMGELLSSLREFGEDTYIIIDSSPVLVTSEPVLLSKWVDGVIMVVMADRTHRESVRRAIQSIDKQKIIGVVLNQKEVKTSGSHSNYYYSYYHHYHR